MKKFEQTLGYSFINKNLLKQALTHRSFDRNNNERLEFLGDSILGFLIADALFDKFVKSAEGDLTKMRARLVRGSTLAEVAREIDLGKFTYLGEGELNTGGFNRDSILADALEAVFGAIYLDGGVAPLRQVVNQLFASRLQAATPENIKDNKTRLQEMLQKKNQPLPIYEVVNETGKSHSLVFEISCKIKHDQSPFVSTGTSRRRAEQKAARQAIDALTSSDSAT